MFDSIRQKMNDHLDQFKSDHELAVSALEDILSTIDSADDGMSRTVGKSADVIRHALSRMHDRIRIMRGGDLEQEEHSW